MSEVIEILKEIKEKLDKMDKRLKRIEDVLFDELSEEELKEIEVILKACKTGKMKTYTLEELKRELEIDEI